MLRSLGRAVGPRPAVITRYPRLCPTRQVRLWIVQLEETTRLLEFFLKNSRRTRESICGAKPLLPRTTELEQRLLNRTFHLQSSNEYWPAHRVLRTNLGPPAFKQSTVAECKCLPLIRQSAPITPTSMATNRNGLSPRKIVPAPSQRPGRGSSHSHPAAKLQIANFRCLGWKHTVHKYGALPKIYLPAYRIAIITWKATRTFQQLQQSS